MNLGQLGLVLCLTLVAARPALSQGASPRQPSGGLFGALSSDLGGSHRLNFSVQVAEGFNSDVAPELASEISGGLQRGGYSTIFDASSNYSHTSKRLQLAGNAATAFRYYQSLDSLDAVSHSVGLGANVTLPKGGSLQVNQSAAIAPAYLYQLFPADDPTLGGSIPTNPDYQIVDNDSYSYNTRLALSFGPTSGTRVTTFGTFTRTDVQQQVATYADVDTYGAGVQVAHRIPRGGLSAAYSFHTGAYGSDGPSEEHRLTLGAQYTQALSRSRRATFSVSITPTQFDGSQSMPDAAVDGQANAKRWLMSGQASVVYPFRLNWLATATYRRDTQYLSVFGQPVVSGGTTVALTGLPARRLDFSVSAGYATADSAYQTEQALKTYTGQAMVRYALKRSIGIYSEYLYYYYDQRGQQPLAPGLPAVFEQHGIRVGVSLYIEALGR